VTGADTGVLEHDGTALLERIGPAALRQFGMALMHGRACETLLAAIALFDAVQPAHSLAELAARDGADRYTVAPTCSASPTASPTPESTSIRSS
jgi:hypothetical protein